MLPTTTIMRSHKFSRTLIWTTTTIISTPHVFADSTAVGLFRGITTTFIPTCSFTTTIRLISEPVSISEQVGGILTLVGDFGGVRLGLLALHGAGVPAGAVLHGATDLLGDPLGHGAIPPCGDLHGATDTDITAITVRSIVGMIGRTTVGTTTTTTEIPHVTVISNHVRDQVHL